VTARAKSKIAVIQFPGVNCEYETARALEAAGARADVVRFNLPAKEISGYDGYVLPGGFAYEDRVRAGAVAAKDAVVEVLAEEAARGKPLLGICNGAQILVEAGIVPGREPGHVEMALAHNRHPYHRGFLNRWVFCRHESTGDVLPLPIAHAEGRFTCADEKAAAALAADGLVYLRYVDEAGDTLAPEYNPNGSVLDAAAIASYTAAAVATMPHPERASWLFQLPGYLPGPWGLRRRRAAGKELAAPGPGRLIFDDFLKLI
jgi:phosphoribosylformylglycinamidine synthase I